MTRLDELDKTCELLVFRYENHMPCGLTRDVDSLATEWCKRHHEKQAWQ